METEIAESKNLLVKGIGSYGRSISLAVFFVAEFENEIIGISIYYFRYSTWKGKRLYLEDIIVTKKYRGKGVGKLLFEETIEKARQEGCTGLMWQVLEWNQPAIEFYKKYQTKLDGEWINCHLDL